MSPKEDVPGRVVPGTVITRVRSEMNTVESSREQLIHTDRPMFHGVAFSRDRGQTPQWALAHAIEQYQRKYDGDQPLYCHCHTRTARELGEDTQGLVLVTHCINPSALYVGRMP